MSATTSDHMRPSAAPPVAEDADALLDALRIAQHRVGPCKESGNGGHWRSTPEDATCIFCKNTIGGPEDIAWEKVELDARAAVRARMRPQVTAEALFAILEVNQERAYGVVRISVESLRAALAALGGAK